MKKSAVISQQFEPIALTVEQAAGASGMGRSSIYEVIRTGELESCVIRGRRLIPVDGLKRFIRKRVEAQAGSTVDPKLSEMKAAAGRRGRAKQLEAAAT
jgi:excisionase family DNA binding protein